MSMKSWLRDYCPNIKFIRRGMSHIKLKEYDNLLLPEDVVRSCEENSSNIAPAITKLRKEKPEYVKKMADVIQQALDNAKDKQHDTEEYRQDMLFCRLAYGFMPDEYLVFKLYDCGSKKRKEYVSDIERFKYVYRMNDIVDIGIYLDKYKTYRKFHKYFKREAIGVESEKDYEAFEHFLNRHEVFVMKQVGLSKGDSVSLEKSSSYPKESRKKQFKEMLSQGKYIIEELIQQDETMMRLNASSVNTIRCITFNTKTGVKIMFCFAKIGRNGAFVDNGGKGGILVGIDHETGQFITDGFDEYGGRYKEHPDSHITLCGFQLPSWNEMITICKEMSMITPSVKYIGWDMAYTSKGWSVVEGNGGGQFIGPQIVFERGIKQEIEEALKGVDLIVK